MGDDLDLVTMDNLEEIVRQFVGRRSADIREHDNHYVVAFTMYDKGVEPFETTGVLYDFVAIELLDDDTESIVLLERNHDAFTLCIVKLRHCSAGVYLCVIG